MRFIFFQLVLLYSTDRLCLSSESVTRIQRAMDRISDIGPLNRFLKSFHISFKLSQSDV